MQKPAFIGVLRRPPYSWSLLGRMIRLGFFLRVPLLTLFLLAALGPLSQFTGARSLLGNLFDQQNDAGGVWTNVFAVSFTAFLLAFTAIATLNLTLLYGTLRFSDVPDTASTGGRLMAKHAAIQQKRPGLTFSLGILAACSLVLTVVWHTGHVGRSLSASAAGFVCAVLFIVVAKITQLVLTDPNVTEHPPPLLVFPAYRLPWLQAWFDKLYCWPSAENDIWPAALLRRFKSKLGSATQKPFHLFSGACQGYLAPVQLPEGTRLKLHSGHVFAAALALLAFATYVVVGFDKAKIRAVPAAIPALAYLLLFFIVGCWTLSALAFFFDRYRFPLLLSVVLLALSTAFVPQSDHFFRVETPASVPRLRALNVKDYLTPAGYLAELARDPNRRRLVFVATPGGGIQAAAWTAKVLQELDHRFPNVNGAGSFRQSTALISSVSGGSLGSMIYAASLAGNIAPDCAAENAQASAIDEVAWGLTSPDFWRSVLPWFNRAPVIDRGWALEQKWAVVNGLSREPACRFCSTPSPSDCAGHNPGNSKNPVEDDTFLSDWAAKGTRLPSLIFNAMLVERGQHVVFSTTRFPEQKDPRGIANFYDLYPDIRQAFDIRVNTAARLSASFPYVAPAARSNLRSPSSPDFHFVDGGYYDNLGVDSLIGWISSAYNTDRTLVRSLPEILIIQIRHFSPDDLAGGSKSGWSFQLSAPLVALLHMWNNSPTNRDRNELNLFVKEYSASGQGPKIQTVTIPYCGADYREPVDIARAIRSCFAAVGAEPLKTTPRALSAGSGASSSRAERLNCAEPPLSWKLTASQKACIDRTWKDFASADPNGALRTIESFLHPVAKARQRDSAVR